VIGGLSYTVWVLLALAVIGCSVWKCGEALDFALFAGLAAWFIQGFGEFSLYIPALAWLAFTLMGALVGQGRIEIDKKTTKG
jgi:hypothetical protein